MAIISHKHQFIFIKTWKTAGTSVEIELSQLCGDDDIVTPIFPIEGDHRARNYKSRAGDFYNHMTGREIRDRIGEDVFARYTKFCVERDPIDKSLSYFAMLKNSPAHNKKTRHLQWDEFLRLASFPVDAEKYCDDDGSVMVDHVLRYEHLEAELASLCAQLGAPFRGVQARAKSGFRDDKIPQREDLTIAEQATIYRGFAANIETLAAAFPSSFGSLAERAQEVMSRAASAQQ